MNVDFDAYKAYRDARGRPPLAPNANGAQASSASATTEPTGGILPAPSAGSNEPPAPYPTSFDHIVDLITKGEPIPGIKDIPDTVLTGQGTQATKSVRKKPWEKDSASVTSEGMGQETT